MINSLVPYYAICWPSIQKIGLISLGYRGCLIINRKWNYYSNRRIQCHPPSIYWYPLIRLQIVPCISSRNPLVGSSGKINHILAKSGSSHSQVWFTLQRIRGLNQDQIVGKLAKYLMHQIQFRGQLQTHHLNLRILLLSIGRNPSKANSKENHI